MTTIKRFFFEVAAPALAVCWTAYIGFGAMAGASGYYALRSLEADALSLKQETTALTEKRAALARRADKLNPRSLDMDMVDERVRAILGYTHVGDVVLPRNELHRLKASQTDQ